MPASSYLFIFGRTPELAFLELTKFFPSAIRLTLEVARVQGDLGTSADELQANVGGTVKIAREIGEIPELTAQSMLPFVPTQESFLHIGISGYGTGVPTAVLPSLKKLLEIQGIRIRYASVKHGTALSSVTVDKAGLTELVVVKTKDGFVVGQTVSVQDYESWNVRDYGRPYADTKSGMLPPKVARMIVNIAGVSSPGTLLDPFCGMGTVLAEAYIAGWRVLGSDIVPDVVFHAQANLDWVKQRYPGRGNVGNIFVCDAVHLSDKIPSESIDAIVTEPFMGSTDIVNQKKLDSVTIKNAIKGLEKMYIGCLRDWKKILVPNGIVVIALPEYAIGGRTYFVKKVIDMCENLGYTTQVGPIEYSRPLATVRRKFFVFQKITKN